MADDFEFTQDPTLARRRRIAANATQQWNSDFPAQSLAGRARQAQDKEQYISDLQDQHDAELRSRAEYDQKAQNFYFRSQELKSREKIDRQAFDQRAELHPLKIQSEEAKASAQAAQQRLAILKEKTMADSVASQAAAAEKLHSRVSELGSNPDTAPGSVGWERALPGIIADNLGAPKLEIDTTTEGAQVQHDGG